MPCASAAANGLDPVEASRSAFDSPGVSAFAGGWTGEGWIYVDQATKGAWGMSWRQEASKGVEDCEKLGGIVKQVLIPRYPNWSALNP